MGTDKLAQLGDIALWAAEALDPELAAVEFTSEHGWRVIGHPLVHQVMPINGQCNRMLRQKKAALAEAIEREEWHSVVFLHERPYRTEALIDYVVGRGEDGAPLPLSGCSPEVIRLACEVWRDSENLQQHEEDWRDMLTEGGTVLVDDPEGFAALPDVLTVWRGEIDDGGISWTLSEKTARWFANRFDGGNDVVSGKVRKADVAGYLALRGESEILVLSPLHVDMA